MKNQIHLDILKLIQYSEHKYYQEYNTTFQGTVNNYRVLLRHYLRIDVPNQKLAAYLKQYRLDVGCDNKKAKIWTAF